MKQGLSLRQIQRAMEIVSLSFSFCENDDASLSTSINGYQVLDVLVHIPFVPAAKNTKMLDRYRGFNLVIFDQVDHHPTFGHVRIGQLLNPSRYRCREEKLLSVSWGGFGYESKNLIYVFLKSLLEHFVCLV